MLLPTPEQVPGLDLVRGLRQAPASEPVRAAMPDRR